MTIYRLFCRPLLPAKILPTKCPIRVLYKFFSQISFSLLFISNKDAISLLFPGLSQHLEHLTVCDGDVGRVQCHHGQIVYLEKLWWGQPTRRDILRKCAVTSSSCKMRAYSGRPYSVHLISF